MLAQIDYQLPVESAEHYGQHALDVLKCINKLDTSLTAYFMAANTVLTLSGVRSFDTYMLFPDSVTQKQIESLQEVLMTLEIGLMVSRFTDKKSGKSHNLFSVFNQHGSRQIKHQYSIAGWVDPPLTNDWSKFTKWAQSCEASLESQLKLENSDVYHDIRFGILLGYPWPAIASLCEATEGSYPEDFLRAKIAHHDKYFSAIPVYDYHQTLVDNKTIKVHEKLWSNILNFVYESSWHNKIKRTKEFKTGLAALERLDQE